MQIYLDYNIGFPLKLQWYPALDETINEVPSGVDLIGLTFFYHDIKRVRPIVDIALEKSKHVAIYFCEFNGPDVVNFEREYHEKHPNLQIFANAIPHYPSRLKHIGEWFMKLDNPYSTENWAMQLLSELDDSPSKPYKFDCLLGKRTHVRDFISSKCQDAGPEDFIFTYFKDNLRDGIWGDVDISSAVDSSTRVVFRNELASVGNILPVKIYNQSHYSIVSDTTCPQEFNFYTEKIAKPMIAGRVFVAFAGQKYLENLRKIGFRTFDGIIDESYDQVADDQQRWQMAWTQVEHLLKQDPVTTKEKARSVTDHNRDFILSTDWAAPIKEYVQKIITSKDL